MTMKLHWEDSDEIGYQLYEKFPEIAPLALRFTDLHKMICELDGFAGDHQASSEGLLESIQMAWLEEWKEDHE
jgi:FeS assembly protein IscX